MKRNLERYVPKDLLKAINPNVGTAIEKCLVFLHFLSPTYYSDIKWKALSSKILHKELKGETDNTYTYKAIIEALKAGTKKSGPIIEVMTNEYGTESFEVGVTSKRYKLTDTYLRVGLEEYLIKDESIIRQRNKRFYRALFETKDNIITQNLISVYPQIDLPTKEEVLKAGKLLCKNGYSTKKGKLLTMRNKHSNNYWKDTYQRSFVEDNIELYSFLTNRGFMIPIVGGDNSGGRVVDSFNLMPSWIRALVKIKGEPIVECDFSAMHPNLASRFYNGTGKSISHQLVADYLGMDISVAKREHLSFFNKPYYPLKKHLFKKYKNKGSMVNSPIFTYYKDNEPEMLENIRKQKLDYGYKSASRNLFKFEVDLMTEVIKRLNKKGVYVLYVYDALYCAASDCDSVKRVMDEVAVEFEVMTKVA